MDFTQYFPPVSSEGGEKRGPRTCGGSLAHTHWCLWDGDREKWVAAAKISLRTSHKRFMMQGMSVNAHTSVTKIIKSYYNITIILHI